MWINCHHCDRLDECSLQWEKLPDGSKTLRLICSSCVFLHAYKFIAYILGR